MTGQVIRTKEASIIFEGAKKIEEQKYRFADGFNRTREASVVIIYFANELKTTFNIK
jgi:predicted transcriptional regulator